MLEIEIIESALIKLICNGNTTRLPLKLFGIVGSNLEIFRKNAFWSRIESGFNQSACLSDRLLLRQGKEIFDCIRNFFAVFIQHKLPFIILEINRRFLIPFIFRHNLRFIEAFNRLDVLRISIETPQLHGTNATTFLEFVLPIHILLG